VSATAIGPLANTLSATPRSPSRQLCALDHLITTRMRYALPPQSNCAPDRASRAPVQVPPKPLEIAVWPPCPYDAQLHFGLARLLLRYGEPPMLPAHTSQSKPSASAKPLIARLTAANSLSRAKSRMSRRREPLASARRRSAISPHIRARQTNAFSPDAESKSCRERRIFLNAAGTFVEFAYNFLIQTHSNYPGRSIVTSANERNSFASNRMR